MVKPPSSNPASDPLGPPTRFDPVIYGALVIIVAVLLALLPATFTSITRTLFGRSSSVYLFPDGSSIDLDQGSPRGSSESYINIAFNNVEEESHTLTVAISGERHCQSSCMDGLELTLVSYDVSAEVLRGLGQWVTIPVPVMPGAFSMTRELPVRGWPGTYPFDEYFIQLGIGGSHLVDGKRVPLEPGDASGVLVTVQNATYDLSMPPPAAVPIEQVDDPEDVWHPVGAMNISFHRPFYLRVLSVALFTMVAVSTVLGLFSRSLPAVVFGNAGLLLGIYSIRSVLVPYSLTVVTAVDVASQLLILLMLIGLVVRIAAIIRQRSDLPVIPGWRPRGDR